MIILRAAGTLTWRWRWRARRRSACVCFPPPRARWFAIRSFSLRLPIAWRRLHRGAPASRWRPVSFRRGGSEGRGHGRPSCAKRSAISASSLRRSGWGLGGEGVEWGRTWSRVRNRSATPTPVYLLAAGPRMIELAGEVADGAFLMVGLHSAAIRAALSHLEQGAARAGRSLKGFPVVFVVTLGLGSAQAG